jgi:hypothetical protein
MIKVLRVRRLMVLAAAAGLLSFTGCFGSKREAYEVTGTVTLNGQPLEFVQVEFWPEVSGGIRSTGTTDAEGKFTLKTDDGLATGASPGRHKVALRDKWHMQDDYLSEGGDWVDMSKGRKSRIHSKYYNPDSSDITAEVVAGQVNNFEFTPDKNPRG